MRYLLIILCFFSITLQGQVKARWKGAAINVYPPPVPADNGAFQFTLASTLRTSAGVFINDSVLVRTLWNDTTYAAGTYTRYWDGKDDYGTTLVNPAATYKVKVLSNNVQYTWQGTIGNTSDNMTGNSKHRGYYHCMRGLAFGATYGYFATGYSEGSPSLGKFLISTPNVKINFPGSGTTADNNYVATDGTIVYWGGFDPFQINNTFVYGTNVSNDADASFSSGAAYTVLHGKTYNSTISKLNQANSFITGLAVQKAGSYLFVVRAMLDQLQVLNKTTGALVQTLTYDSARSICVDGSDNLWMVTGNNTVAKYTVNANGTLTAATLTLSGLLAPLATQVSYDGTLISVADGSTSQQVKFFNNTTGTSTNTLGTSGGYTTDANVTDYKFQFSDANSVKNLHGGADSKIPFIAYQSDGTFWVSDPGDFRVQHYNSSRVFINRVMWLGASYFVYADKNNPAKVFSDLLEFEVDYSVQTLTGSAGWVLKRNFSAARPYNVYNGYPADMTTLSNGKTYGMARLWTGGQYEVVELPVTGQIRYTGVLLANTKRILCQNGSLQEFILTGAGSTTYTIKQYPLSSFDGSSNPVWSGTGALIAVGIKDNVYGNSINIPFQEMLSTNNKAVWFNYRNLSNSAVPGVFQKGYHLGVMQKGANNVYQSQTEQSTRRNYIGQYPAAGWFDAGNGVSDFAGGVLMLLGRNIITSYHGEFWKGSQTNKYNHYYDNGLAIGQFGTTRPEISGHAAAMMAGNALTPMVVSSGATDSAYLWHGDESDHSGIHRWKITGLNTITEQAVTIAFPSGYVTPTLPYTDLMSGLRWDTTLLNNTAGWTRTPTTDAVGWDIKSSRLSYNRGTNDLYINYQQATVQTFYLNRDLGTNNVSTNWKIIGSVFFGYNLSGLGNNAYVEVLDINGKVLTKFYGNNDFAPSSPKVFINTLSATSTTIGAGLSANNTFELSISAGVVSFIYAGYSFPTTTISDGTGDWTKPKTLRVRFNSVLGLPNVPLNYDISNLKLYKDY